MPLGLRRGNTVVESYDPDWPGLFEVERCRIVAAIGHIVAGVHHVGSTSIPGMSAKPILDIAVLLHDFDDGERCIRPLEKIGYAHMGVMDDIPGDRVFHKGSDFPGEHPEFAGEGEVAGLSDSRRRIPMIQTHILHMYTPDNPVRDNHFHFRDYLIAHPGTAAEYADLKLALADTQPKDRRAYSGGKRSFIKAVLAKAAKEFSPQGIPE